MADYYYKEYNITYTPDYYYNASSYAGSDYHVYRMWKDYGYGAPAMLFSEGATGYYQVGVNIDLSEGVTFYFGDGATTSQYSAITYEGIGDYSISYPGGVQTWTFDEGESPNLPIFTVSPGLRYTSSNSGGNAQAGSYRRTVEAADGTYPDNGTSSGYWYIKQGEVKKSGGFLGQL